MALRYLVPALASAGLAAAACSGTVTISNSADAAALSTCLTYSGDIAIATGTTDDIALDGIRRINGNLVANGVPKMSSLSATSLSQIDDTFGLKNIQILTTLSFPALTSVDQIVWQGLPNLQGLSFSSEVSQASVLNIQNTALSSLEGINLEIIDQLTLTNNPYLEQVSMQLGNVSQSLSLAANGKDVQVEFPNLIWANNMTFRNVSSLNIDSLSSVNGSLGFYSNFFDSVAAPNLTTIGGSLTFVSNGALTNVSMPELKSIVGAFQVANNSQYGQISGFNRLSQVGGAVDCFGTFSSVSLPALQLVKGNFNLQSTKDITNTCNHFHQIAGPNNDIRGQFTCKGKQQSASGSGLNSPDSGSGSGSSKSAAATNLIPGTTGILALVAAIFGML